MIFENVYEYFMYLGVNDAFQAKKPRKFTILNACTENCYNNYMLGYLMANNNLGE